MDRKDRDKIDRCVDSMMEILNMTILWPFLLQYEIFNRDDVNVPVWEQSLNDRKTVREILLTIKTRGPYAYRNLIKSLSEANYRDLVDMLENSRLTLANNNSSETEDRQNGFDRIDRNDPLELYDPSQAEGPVKVVVHKAEKFLDRSENQIIPRYPMRTRIRGLVLIITLIDYKGNSNRVAAEHDEKNLIDLFQQMGFEVFPRRNLTVTEIRDALQDFASNKKFRNVASCFVIISGHGARSSMESQTVIIDKFNEEITVGEILSYFIAEKCLNLINKPKVFIFQTCRGAIKQRSVLLAGKNMNENNEFMFKFDDELPKSTISTSPQTNFPANDSVRNYADILVAHSTLPGHVSFRDKITGTWYIQLLCTIFMKYARNHHVHDLLLMVDDRLQHLRNSQKDCQTSTVKTIGFNKHLYINPGLFENDE